MASVADWLSVLMDNYKVSPHLDKTISYGVFRSVATIFGGKTVQYV